MKDILPCFTPNEMEELGLGENGFYTSNPHFNPNIFFNYYKENKHVENVERYREMVSEAYYKYMQETTDLNAQKLLELGWNPEVAYNSISEMLVTECTKERLNDIEIIDLTESDDLLDTTEDSLIMGANKAISIIRKIPLGDLPERFSELDKFEMTDKGTLKFYTYTLKEDNEDVDKLLGVIDKVNKELVDSGNQYILIKKFDNIEKEQIPRTGELEMEYFMASGYNPYINMDFEESTNSRFEDMISPNGDANVIVSYDIEDEEEPEE